MIKQRLSSKQLKLSSIFTLSVLLIISIVLITFAITYFSVSVFYVNNHKYKVANEESNRILYQSREGPTIEVAVSGHNRTVLIDGEEYLINSTEEIYQPAFNVSYPDGNQYTVKDHSGMLLSYDENDEIVDFVSVHAYASDGTEIINNAEEGEKVELYYPSSLVEAAYTEYHEKQGVAPIYWAAVFLLIFGWCQFRYVKFQDFLYKITPRYSWQDDEPNDFHYFLFKLGGVLLMIASLPIFLKSL